VRVRLIKKLAEKIDGIDLTARERGDVLDLSPAEGRLLIAEGWAVAHHQDGNRREYIPRTSQLKTSAAQGM
jgi:hypothetical protein